MQKGRPHSRQSTAEDSATEDGLIKLLALFYLVTFWRYVTKLFKLFQTPVRICFFRSTPATQTFSRDFRRNLRHIARTDLCLYLSQPPISTRFLLTITLDVLLGDVSQGAYCSQTNPMLSNAECSGGVDDDRAETRERQAEQTTEPYRSSFVLIAHFIDHMLRQLFTENNFSAQLLTRFLQSVKQEFFF